MTDGPSDIDASPVPIGAMQAAGHVPQKHTQRFRRTANAIRLTPDQQRRQAGVMSAGWRVLGSRPAMLDFFNDHSDELGGRPLDIALDSEDGFARIIAKLRDIHVSSVHRTVENADER